MNRLNLLLSIALVLCALSLVNAQHQARQLFVMLDRAQAEATQLKIEWSRLQYEQSALGKSARVVEIARTKLKMTAAQAGRTQYLQGFVGLSEAAAAISPSAMPGAEP